MITLSEIEFETEDQINTFRRIKELIVLSNRIKNDEWQLEEKQVVYGSIQMDEFIIKPVHPMGLGSGFSTINAHGKLQKGNSIVVKFKLSIASLLGIPIVFFLVYQLVTHFDKLELPASLIPLGIFGFILVMSVRRIFKDLRKTEKLVTNIIERNLKAL